MGVEGDVEMGAPPPPGGYAPPPPGGYAPPPPGGYAPAAYATPPPFPGVPIVAPPVAPQPGMVIVGYQLNTPQTGCCQCDGLSAAGWILVLLAVLFFWPIAFVICCIPELFDKTQYPLYGYPGGPPPPPPHAQ